jgi:ribosomal protein S18 acetylase RimI-like enzyme
VSAVVFGPRDARRDDERRIRSTCSEVQREHARVQRTPALGEIDARWFESRGFRVVQSLVMLRRDTKPHGSRREHDSSSALSAYSWRKLRSRRHAPLLAELLQLDSHGFAAPWNLSRDAFARACTATFDHVVIVSGSGETTGFALVGRSAQTAYLQRLVVRTDVRRRGIARRLVQESLAWAHSRGAIDLLVNTEPSNDGALALYRSLGFVTVPDRLSVLERELEQPA